MVRTTFQHIKIFDQLSSMLKHRQNWMSSPLLHNTTMLLRDNCLGLLIVRISRQSGCTASPLGCSYFRIIQPSRHQKLKYFHR